MARLFDLLVQRHRRLLELFAELDVPRTPRLQAAFEEVLERELLAHAEAEQELVYPALAARRPDSRALADARALHAGILGALAELRVLPRGDPRRPARSAALQRLVHLHILHEESVLLEIVGWLVPADELAALGGRVAALEWGAEGFAEPGAAEPERRLLH